MLSAHQYIRNIRTLLVMAVAALSLTNFTPAFAADKAALAAQAKAALQSLYDSEPKAKALGDISSGVLVFPDVTRAGLVVGGSSGDGVLFMKGKIGGYYRTNSLSVGMQAGIQSFGYAVFFSNDVALKEFQSSKGWDVGTSPTLVVVDEGVAKDLDTRSLESGTYAFIFDQKGLMAGMALKGQKISRIK